MDNFEQILFPLFYIVGLVIVVSIFIFLFYKLVDKLSLFSGFEKVDLNLISFLKQLEKTITQMKRDLKDVGYLLIFFASISFLFDNLDPAWGIFLAIFGVLTLLIKQRMMFILTEF